MHYVLMVQYSVQLDFSVNLAGGTHEMVTIEFEGNCVTSDVQCQQCAQAPRLRAYLLALVRLGDARVRDDFGCVNFAGGEVGHLVAFSEASLERGKELLTCFVFSLRGKSTARFAFGACATFPKTFPRQ